MDGVEQNVNSCKYIHIFLLGKKRKEKIERNEHEATKYIEGNKRKRKTGPEVRLVVVGVVVHIITSFFLSLILRFRNYIIINFICTY